MGISKESQELLIRYRTRMLNKSTDTVKVERETMVFAPLTEEERSELQSKVEWYKEFINEVRGGTIMICEHGSLKRSCPHCEITGLENTIQVAIYELEKLEPLLEMPERGYVRNNFNSILRTLKEGL